MQRPRCTPALVLSTLALALGGLPGDRALAVDDATRGHLQRFVELVDAEHAGYGSEVRYEHLLYAAIDGMLRTLDPHTSFLSPQDYAEMRERQQSSFYGIGILIGTRDGQLTVISPIEGGPAARLGIQAGDVISAVEGEPTEAMSLDDAIQKIKGPKGTQVEITIVRRGLDEPLVMSLTRAEIQQTTVRQAYMLTPDTGYILLTEFSRGSGREMADAVTRLSTQGMKRLLLDLRNNGGGLLDQSIEVAQLFLAAGSVVVETRGRVADSIETHRADGKHAPLDIPVVVLVNEGTASAAEIVSGALQDHDVALVVGQPSWGKGLVQTVFNLSYGAGLALTTSKYYTPAGRLIQRDYSSFFDYYLHEDAGAPKDPTKAEVFRTGLGREVFGGGGITPDVAVELPELADFAAFLRARSAYFNFGVDYQRRHPVDSVDWTPGPAVLDELRSWLIEEELATATEVEEGLADADMQAFSLLQVRAEVLGSAFGPEARDRVLAGGDAQIQAALGLFGRASELLAQRRGRPSPAQADGSRDRHAASEQRVAALAAPFRSAGPAPAGTDDAGPEDEDSRYKYLAVFSDVLGLVQRAYVDEPDMEMLMAGAFEGTTDALDPLSSYVPPATAASLSTSTARWQHSGAVVLEERGITYVVAVEKESPAGAAGMEAGDIVAQVNGRATRTMPAWEIQRLLAGEPGTTLELELVHLGESRQVSLLLAPFMPPPPTVSTIGGAMVLRIPSFDATTAKRVETLLEEATTGTQPGLVVDLRGVSSGDPAAAYVTAALFADGDLGSLVSRELELASFASDRSPRWQGRLVVLVNRGTLGAAEVMATVLRQKAGAELVGERTFGHAGRQRSTELATGGRLLFTEAFYTGPDGKPLDEPLRPDVLVDERSRTLLEKDVPMTELILQRGVELLLASEEAPERKAA